MSLTGTDMIAYSRCVYVCCVDDVWFSSQSRRGDFRFRQYSGQVVIVACFNSFHGTTFFKTFVFKLTVEV